MLTGLMTYYTVGFSLIIVTIIIYSISYAYRIMEQAVKGTALLFLSLSFLVAALFQNSVSEKLLVQYMIPYALVKQLDVSVINAFKGPLITPTISTASWTGASYLILLVAVMILVTGTLTAYMSSLMLGVSRTVAYAITGVVLVMAIGGVVLTHMSISTYTANPAQNMDRALALRAYSNILKALTIIIPYAIMAIGSYILWKETQTGAYAIYLASIVLGLIGFIVFTTTWTYGWDLYVEKLAASGQIGKAILRFAVSAFLMIVGALGLLVGSIFEAMPPAEEIPEELPEETIETA